MGEKRFVPELRFPEFDDFLIHKLYGDIYSFYTTNSFSRDKLNYEQGEVYNIHYGDIHTKFSTGFDIEKENVPFINKEIDLQKINKECYCQEGDLVVADASEDYNDIGKTIELLNLNNKKVLAGLHTFLARPNKDNIATGFAGYLLQTWKVRKQIMTISQGTKVLSLSTGRLSKIKLDIPGFEEQQKIATFLTSIDERIQLLEKKKKSLEDYKKGIMQKIFSQEIRFKDEKGKDFPDWEKKRLEEVLNYEQPTKYLVADTEYKDEYDIPVLTAGKTFLLGFTNETKGVFRDNLPTIIFDDFTTAFQFVDFPFKAKSSAMKMLISKTKETNMKFIFEAMKTIKFPLAEHKRYWISEYQKEKISYPCIDEQQKIASFLSSIDESIEQVAQQIEHSKTYKKGLLQKMFV